MLSSLAIGKPLIIALLVSISLNCLFGYLSYSFYYDKAVAEAQLASVVNANKDLKESLNKKDMACKITDVIVSDYTKEKQEIVKEKDRDLNAIDNMVAKPVLPKLTSKKAAIAAEGAAVEENNVVSLDGKLSDDLKRVLSQSCHSAKGGDCDYP